MVGLTSGWLHCDQERLLIKLCEFEGQRGRRCIGRSEREREREGQRESKREDFENLMGCISGTRRIQQARLVPSESASNSNEDRVVNAEGLC
jgi:hypothetical protein